MMIPALKSPNHSLLRNLLQNPPLSHPLNLLRNLLRNLLQSLRLNPLRNLLLSLLRNPLRNPRPNPRQNLLPVFYTTIPVCGLALGQRTTISSPEMRPINPIFLKPQANSIAI